ncbi:hypothetical protein [Roseovarius sp. MMSF_3281]|uniref:hypothetical protein n=1 Tax=Roseovarius sp. MMSF_3281 TaxID=3046694 RepID=UPI00273EB5DE|nr:hypothetical protein [Roseovarius sp. MMSF_3281]
MKDPTKIPEHWGDLEPEQRAALMAMAEDRIWWEGAKTRVRKLGPWMSWATVIIGGFVFFKDHIISLAAWVASFGGPAK